jgi:hypothetical protein
VCKRLLVRRELVFDLDDCSSDYFAPRQKERATPVRASQDGLRFKFIDIDLGRASDLEDWLSDRKFGRITYLVATSSTRHSVGDNHSYPKRT